MANKRSNEWTAKCEWKKSVNGLRKILKFVFATAFKRSPVPMAHVQMIKFCFGIDKKRQRALSFHLRSTNYDAQLKPIWKSVSSRQFIIFYKFEKFISYFVAFFLLGFDSIRFGLVGSFAYLVALAFFSTSHFAVNAEKLAIDALWILPPPNAHTISNST